METTKLYLSPAGVVHLKKALRNELRNINLTFYPTPMPGAQEVDFPVELPKTREEIIENFALKYANCPLSEYRLQLVIAELLIDLKEKSE